MFMCTLRTCLRYLKGAPNLAICVSKKNQSHITKTSDGNQKSKGEGGNPRFFPLPDPHAAIQSKKKFPIGLKNMFKVSEKSAQPSSLRQ